MEINISIKKIGHAIGTIGWLAENADHIKIGESKGGFRCAWLMDKSGKSLTILAMDEYGTINRVTREMNQWPVPCDFAATDACWSIVEKLADIAVEAMAEDAELADGFKISVAGLHNA